MKSTGKHATTSKGQTPKRTSKVVVLPVHERISTFPIQTETISKLSIAVPRILQRALKVFVKSSIDYLIFFGVCDKVGDVPKPIHAQMARIGLALSSPVRLRALTLLAQRSWAVSQLASELGESLASTSAHLKVLRSSCLVVDEKVGRQVWCRVASDEVLDLMVAVRKTAEALLPELTKFVQQAKQDPHALQGLTLAELEREVKAGRAVLLDLRPAEEYRAGHLPRAHSLPVSKIASAALDAWEPAEMIVAYCRGPWCTLASLGVQALRDRGISVQQLYAGVVEWQTSGLSLESPEPTTRN